MYPDDSRARRFRPTVRWASRWAKEHNISKRRRSNSKTKSAAELSHKIRPFHRGLRILIQEPTPPSPGSRGSPVAAPGGGRVFSGEHEGGGTANGPEVTHPHEDRTYGRCPLQRRYNVDQVLRGKVMYLPTRIILRIMMHGIRNTILITTQMLVGLSSPHPPLWLSRCSLQVPLPFVNGLNDTW